MLDVINKALRPLKKRMRLMTSRVTLNSTSEKGLLAGQYEALEGETIEDAERLENYGLAGRPPAGAEGFLLSVGGARDHPIIGGLEHREHRPELAEGETQLYSMFKQMIHLDKDGNMRFKAKAFIFEGESFEATLAQGVKMSGSAVDVAAPGGYQIDGSLHVTRRITSGV